MYHSLFIRKFKYILENAGCLIHKKEVPWIEEREGRLFAYEFKWSSTAKVAPPKDFIKTYPDAHFERVDPKNYLTFIT